MEESLARSLKLFPIVVLLCFASLSVTFARISGSSMQPLSKIAIHKATLALRESVSIKAIPHILGLKGDDTEWVTVNLVNPDPSMDDWVAVFSPANFELILQLVCQIMRIEEEDPCPYRPACYNQVPCICTSPIKSFLPVISPQNLSNPLKVQGAISCCIVSKVRGIILHCLLRQSIHKMSGVKRARTTRTGTGSSSQEQEVADPMMTLERRMEYLRGGQWPKSVL
ncbi:putative inactive purple acid phosphatase 24 [Morella rubra]|uniref:Putative inactive purple acid phosphatase 24 n=1 Tax=Morella rubra TaxID=262757 RepID=A0A6A1VWJ8_9ROSI|nr:putative inactive purple acid phosphatase 24 [Morella rubra]